MQLGGNPPQPPLGRDKDTNSFTYGWHRHIAEPTAWGGCAPTARGTPFREKPRFKRPPPIQWRFPFQGVHASCWTPSWTCPGIDNLSVVARRPSQSGRSLWLFHSGSKCYGLVHKFWCGFEIVVVGSIFPVRLLGISIHRSLPAFWFYVENSHQGVWSSLPERTRLLPTQCMELATGAAKAGARERVARAAQKARTRHRLLPLRTSCTAADPGVGLADRVGDATLHCDCNGCDSH